MRNNSTILIVDDQFVGREVLRGLLIGQGYNLAFASNGPEALRLAAKLTPDLILLDIMMPGMNGFEVCRCLRGDPFLAEIPIMMITALDDEKSRLRGLKAGAEEFISKPFNEVELQVRVQTIMRLNRYRQLSEERAKYQKASADLAEAYDQTLNGWARALELRDKETEGHSQRVIKMTMRLARAMGISEDQLVHVHRGALLHDIGKMAVPDNILLKPGPLNDSEWEIMRQHPVYAYNLLYPISFLRSALDIPYYHHEKWNGRGYPCGLRGTDIPLAARIFAVVDVWDALSFDRPYRAAWPRHKVLAYIREQAGQHFDPEVVELFLKLQE